MKRETKELKPWQGFVTFGIVILFTQLIAFPIQRAIGLWGVFLTEIGLLAIALLASFIFKGNLKKDFSFNKFTPRQFFGGMFIWLGAMWIGLAVSFIIMWLFPEMAERSAGMTAMFTSENIFVGILIVAISPAICEEMLHRGFIMGSFAGIKNKALVVIMTGIIFGIFHLDAYRFLQTAILGAAFAYIVVETKSIFLTMMFHFMNNFYSLIVGFIGTKLGVLNEEAVKTTQSMMNGTMAVANFLIYCALALGAVYGGYMLIAKREKKHLVRNIVIVVSVSVAMLLSGLVVNVINVLNSFSIGKTITEWTFGVTADDRIEEPVIIDEDGKYVVYVDMDVSAEGAVGAMLLTDEKGEIYFNCTGSGLQMESTPIDLKKGEYTVEIFSVSNREEWNEYAELTGTKNEMLYDFLDPEAYDLTGSYKIVQK